LAERSCRTGLAAYRSPGPEPYRREMHPGGPWKGRGFVFAVFAVALVLLVPASIPAAGAATGRPAFAAARHSKHHAKHKAKHHAKHKAKRVATAAVVHKAAPKRAAKPHKAAKPHPKRHKAKKHTRARRTALAVAVAARLRSERAAKRRRQQAAHGKKKKAAHSAAGVTTMPSPLRIAGLALLALLPFVLIDAWLILTDRRRRNRVGRPDLEVR
jgi:hypothetical protein